jgi:hypothetical protein
VLLNALKFKSFSGALTPLNFFIGHKVLPFSLTAAQKKDLQHDGLL